MAKAAIAATDEARARARQVDKEADPGGWRKERARAVNAEHLVIYRTLADPAYLPILRGLLAR